MLTAKEARDQINSDNSVLLKSIEDKIEQAVLTAVSIAKTSATIYLLKYLQPKGQQVIINKMKALGYSITYESFSSMRAEDSSESFHIEW